ncbi:MAG: peptidase [Sphingobacteriales bacterium]|nr:peptidase [Sphingobacteriales bacterium]
MKIFRISIIVLFLVSCASKKQNLVVDNDVSRIISTLSADDMEGRSAFTNGINKAAFFIEDEFKKIGLQPLTGENGFRQQFNMRMLKPVSSQIILNNKVIDAEDIFIISDKQDVSFTNTSEVEVLRIEKGERVFKQYQAILQREKPVLVLVDEAHSDAFKRLRERSLQNKFIDPTDDQKTSAVFILGNQVPKTFSVTFKNQLQDVPLYNIAGIIPGKTKAKELVIFSAHYDHLGLIEPIAGDSIANGADDDASGITAVISLAKHYKKLGNNERTLVFVAFTAEELGGFGSQHFSSKLSPDDIVAMFNIEMIGKDSKFGKNSAFITGYEKSDFGKILQKNLTGSIFKFYADPYPEQNLFYRSDNATLAALGVPAHTISTDQIDKDKFYHTVDDELSTLDVQNIIATIHAIALSSRSIVDGTDTPTRLTPLKE